MAPNCCAGLAARQFQASDSDEGDGCVPIAGAVAGVRDGGLCSGHSLYCAADGCVGGVFGSVKGTASPWIGEDMMSKAFGWMLAATLVMMLQGGARAVDFGERTPEVS